MDPNFCNAEVFVDGVFYPYVIYIFIEREKYTKEAIVRLVVILHA